MEADRLWQDAEFVSNEAGHPYKNRAGDFVYPKGTPPQMSNDVIEKVKQLLADGGLTTTSTPV